MIDEKQIKHINSILFHQLDNFWSEECYTYNRDNIEMYIPQALKQMEENYSAMPSKRFFDGKQMVFNPMFSVTWMIFLYRLSRILYLNGDTNSADCIYYLNKIMHSNDWFYQVDLPIHFMAEHPLGSVLGKAKYGDFLFVYQGTTVGGNRTESQLFYPSFGNNVVLYANSTVLGKTNIGNNVIISANSYIINAEIPDNSIVFGRYPNIIVKRKTEHEIRQMTSHLWNWSSLK